MVSTIEEIENTINQAVSTGFRGRLLERGLARSMIWTDGLLPEGAPHFSEKLSYDLLSYGYSLLSLGIQLKQLNGNNSLCISAFEKAARAIGDVIHNGNPNNLEKGFHKVIASSAYHLGHFSAKAFSLIQSNLGDENLTPMERILSLLILRKFNKIESIILKWKESGIGSDSSLCEKMELELNTLNASINSGEENKEFGISSVELPIIDLALTDNYYSSIFEFLCALEIGDENLIVNVLERIDKCIIISREINMISQWWIFRITRHLINDLWESSFHKVIPYNNDDTHKESWLNLRWLFISSLLNRSKAEIELWPSQIEGANRAINDHDNLVVSLPTSAGKTRVAELCILRCLAIGKRVLYITPLRSLSAQTEFSLRRTFTPLGKTVSSLYGSIGTSDFEQDVLRTKDIVVGTPEKLDFALRNDSTLIDDIGLIILDEGHMIGLGEREINYEVQIQRLLRREDAINRRIVCLSAILPSGEQFDDFVNWLRQDSEGDAVQSNWRPTDLRFGEIIWREGRGKINFIVGEEQPFIPSYIRATIPSIPNPGIRTTPFPKNQQELTLATAWRLIEDNHTVLIYSPLKKSVKSFAPVILDLHKRGVLNSVLTVSTERLKLAKALGQEWLGEDHPILECLDIGVAIHHGSLPTPFRKEMENLLREGILKVIVASPTLAQGLNLSATALILHSLYRNRKVIDSSEFKNVIGRAGRAFVDTYGLILHPIFDKHRKRKKEWKDLINDTNEKNMESGLALLVKSLILRMDKSLGHTDKNDTLEYILNNTQIWDFPQVSNEQEEQTLEQMNKWDKHIVHLDTALLSILGEEEITTEDIPEKLNIALESSLWQRILNRHELLELFNSMLINRAKYIWNLTSPNQRKGYYLAGVGLQTGRQLDYISQEANVLLINTNIYIGSNNEELAIENIIKLAELIFNISPFIPYSLPESWQNILSAWLRGENLTSLGLTNISEALDFVEDGLIYRLPWGLEAIRVRAQANEDIIEEGTTITDYEVGLVAPAIENGTLNRSAALLMQAGFNSRNAAILAVNSTNATFTNAQGLVLWLSSDEISNLANTGNWPTTETSSLWLKFTSDFQPESSKIWNYNFKNNINVAWYSSYTPLVGTRVKFLNDNLGNTNVINYNGEKVGILNGRYNLKKGTYIIVIIEGTLVNAQFWGEGDTPFVISS